MVTSARIKRELTIAAVLLLIGLVPVPIAVYFVGQAVVGPYEGAAGLFGIMGQIVADLTGFRLGAWILVLSPYLIIQLLRVAIHAQRNRRSDVTRVTDFE